MERREGFITFFAKYKTYLFYILILSFNQTRLGGERAPLVYFAL